jgi:hypothetical protein
MNLSLINISRADGAGDTLCAADSNGLALFQAVCFASETHLKGSLVDFSHDVLGVRTLSLSLSLSLSLYLSPSLFFFLSFFLEDDSFNKF